MLRIMLVEDEPPIMRELIATIRSFGEDYQIVARAANGHAALEAIKKLGKGIDVMITDLHIPGIDGLALIERARKEQAQLTCIILTGYSEFAYAQKAIELKVSNYLLKPVNEEELKELLARALQKRWFADAYVRGDLRLGKNGSLVYVASMCIGAYPYYTTLENILPSELWDYFNLNAIIKNGDILAGVLVEDGFASTIKNVMFSLKSGKTLSHAKELFESLKHELIPLNVALCGAFSSMFEIREGIQAALGFLRQNLVFGNSKVFILGEAHAKGSPLDNALPDNTSPSNSEMPSCSNDISPLSYDICALAELFNKGKQSLFQIECASLFQCIKQAQVTQLQAASLFEALYRDCAGALDSGFCSMEGGSSPGEIINEAFMLSSGYDTLAENLMMLFSDMESLRCGHKSAQTKVETIAAVEEYIRQHYTKPINTALVAKAFGFTPAYLSKIFRAYRNISPLEYVVKLRIEKAKRLLTDSAKLSIRDVAASSGYEDPLYFSKVFKKEVGISPKQYAEARVR